MATKYLIQRVTCPYLIRAIGALRYDTWIRETEEFSNLFADNSWVDSLDETARNFIIICDGKLVASARYSVHHSLNDF